MQFSIRGKARETLLFFHCLPKIESLIISLVFARNFIKKVYCLQFQKEQLRFGT